MDNRSHSNDIFVKLLLITFFLMVPLLFLTGFTFFRIGYHSGQPVEEIINRAANTDESEEISKTQEEKPKIMYYFPVQPPSVCGYVNDHHDYPAVDIFAPVGTPVVAVTDGIIDWLSTKDTWDPKSNDPALRGGLSIAIIGNDGIRYYGSHLSDVIKGLKTGMRVSAGQVLGYVGRTGNAAATPPHLHFGISKPTFPSDWKVRRGQIWPQPYMDKWKQGIMVTPEFPEE